MKFNNSKFIIEKIIEHKEEKHVSNFIKLKSV